MSAIEDIILDRDRRGISKLRWHLPEDYCKQAAQLVLDHPGHAFICSGFYIVSAQAPETDGPPGAYFIGRALQQLGYQVTHVTDWFSAFLYDDLPGAGEVVQFPIADARTSQRFARGLLRRLRPSVLISTERCGLTAKGRYLNMRGVEISQYNAKLDHLFFNHDVTVGIGDGGNEIGMGNLAEQIPSVESLPREPATTPVTRLVLASVSNWGAYGLVAALSQLVGRNLLPAAQEEEQLIREMVGRGGVDGYNAVRAYAVDGFSLEENRKTLERLHTLLLRQGIPAPQQFS